MLFVYFFARLYKLIDVFEANTVSIKLAAKGPGLNYVIQRRFVDLILSPMASRDTLKALN